jgi:plasmid maintenance system antidote protein VapI
MATAERSLSRVDVFLADVEATAGLKGRKITWDERVELIFEHFPGAKNPDWNSILSDIDTLGEVIRDILRLEQATPGKSGPRPAPEIAAGMKTMRRWTGEDHTVLPFAQAFAVLSRGYSLSHLARKTDLDRNKVNRLLKGEHEPTPMEMDRVARAFGKQPSYFLEFRMAYVLAALAAKLQEAPEATIPLYRKVLKGS